MTLMDKLSNLYSFEGKRKLPEEWGIRAALYGFKPDICEQQWTRMMALSLSNQYIHNEQEAAKG